MFNFIPKHILIIFACVIITISIMTTGCQDERVYTEPNEPKSCTELKPGTVNCTIDGREYQVYVPQSYTGETPVPLVVDMHGHYGTSQFERSISPWTDLVETHNFIIAYPQGLKGAWNAQGYCCGFDHLPQVIDDVAFIEDVVARIQAAANIDPNRIIATGISNGGSMTQTLACESSHIFTAAVPMDYPLSGSGGIDGIIANCVPERPIPVIHFHGGQDNDVVYKGNGDRLGARDSNLAWSIIQNCSTELVRTQIDYYTFCETYEHCNGDVSVSLCTATDGGHGVTFWIQNPDIATISLEFLEQFFPD